MRVFPPAALRIGVGVPGVPERRHMPFSKNVLVFHGSSHVQEHVSSRHFFDHLSADFLPAVARMRIGGNACPFLRTNAPCESQSDQRLNDGRHRRFAVLEGCKRPHVERVGWADIDDEQPDLPPDIGDRQSFFGNGNDEPGALPAHRITVLPFHVVGLHFDRLQGAFQQTRLPDHRASLQKADYDEAACEPGDSVLYLEILSALLAGLIASWGGWLWAGGHRAWGAVVAGLALWLFLSFTTTLTFGDPCFWRVGSQVLRGESPRRYEYQTEQYRQPLQHDGENVSQQLLDAAWVPVRPLNPVAQKPSLIEFIKAAGAAGATSALCSFASFAIAYREHEYGKNVSTGLLVGLGCALFCWGAYIAWSNERKERIRLEEQRARADIRSEIYRVSIDTQRFGEHSEPIPVDDGVCVSLLLKAVNHGHDAWAGTWPTLEISFGGKIYSGRSTRVPDRPNRLNYDDLTLYDRTVYGLMQMIFARGAEWPHGLPRVGTLSFIVPGVDPNIMETEVRASGRLTIYDSLGNPHPSDFADIPIAKSLIKLLPTKP